MSNELETRLTEVESKLERLEARIEKTIKNLEPVIELLGQTTLRVQAIEERIQADGEN